MTFFFLSEAIIYTKMHIYYKRKVLKVDTKYNTGYFLKQKAESK